MRLRFVEAGLAAALGRKASSRACERKLDGAGEARLIALACSDPPQGRKRWSLRLLADRIVALEMAPEPSHETVRQILGKNQLKPHLRKMWCIPLEQSVILSRFRGKGG